MKIKCPYCFGDFHDNQVHFRSEKVVTEDELELIYPEIYDSFADFLAKYGRPDKKEIIKKYKAAEFFLARISEKYQSFWKTYGNNITEQDPKDKYFKVKSYERKVIDPSNEEHQKYLIKQGDGSFFIRDKVGMVSKIQLHDNQTCHRRVCPHCHNPLPEEYGRNEVKFISVIGVRRAGKTVFLSQLLRRMENVGAKVGLTISVMNPFTAKFISDNQIDVRLPLPQGTPPTVFLQPLFYDVEYLDSNNKRKQATFILYDVAGEVFEMDVVRDFAKFVEHSHGVIVLIDPKQIELIGQGNFNDAKEENANVTTVFHSIRTIMNTGDEEKCKKPIAVCVSKTDSLGIKNALGPTLSNLLLKEVTAITHPETRLSLRKFNASEYNPIANELTGFFSRFMGEINQLLNTRYQTYAYFGFSALGCETEERVAPDGTKKQFPIGPVIPMRLEEPILWLFNKLGYIGTDCEIHDSDRIIIRCPKCGSENYIRLEGDKREVVIKKGVFGIGKQVAYYDYQCGDCDHKFNQEKRR